MAHGRVVDVKDESHWQSLLAETKGSFGGKGMVVDFSATWCGPCQMIGPVFAQLSNQYPALTFAKVDVDELSGVAGACGVRAMPTFHAFFQGEKVDEMVGADRGKLQAMVEKLAARSTSLGTGRKLGGDAAAGAAAGAGAAGGAAEDTPEARRQRMLAAAEARMKAAGQ